MARQYPWGLWGHEYICTASISSHLGSDSDGHNGETLFTTWAAGVQGRRHRRQGHKSSQFNHYESMMLGQKTCHSTRVAGEPTSLPGQKSRVAAELCGVVCSHTSSKWCKLCSQAVKIFTLGGSCRQDKAIWTVRPEAELQSVVLIKMWFTIFLPGYGIGCKTFINIEGRSLWHASWCTLSFVDVDTSALFACVQLQGICSRAQSHIERGISASGSRHYQVYSGCWRHNILECCPWNFNEWPT